MANKKLHSDCQKRGVFRYAKAAPLLAASELKRYVFKGVRINESNFKKTLDTLSSVVNVSTGLAHPLDESRAKELFKALHKYGVPLKASDVYSLAINNSWPECHAKKLSEMAEKIGNGGRVQIKHPRDWGEPTVRRIISALGQKT